MRFGYLTIILTVLSLTLTGQAHDKLPTKRHWKRVSKRASNSTDVGPRAQLEKRFDNAKFSFYDAGVSACGGTFSNSDYIVAVNVAQYAGGALCFQTITITANGKTTTAKIVDECEGCPYAGLDFSRGLFDFFASEGAGIIYGTWTLGAGAPHTTSTWQAPTPSPSPTPTPTSTWTSTAWSTTSWANTTSSTLVSSSSSVQSSSTSATTTSTSVQETPSGVIGEMYLLFVQLGTMVVVA